MEWPEVRKLLGWDPDRSVKGKRESGCKGNCSPSPTGRLMPHQSPSNGQLGSHPFLPFFLYPSFRYWAWCYIDSTTLFSPWIPAQSSAYPRVIAEQEQKALMLCQLWSTIAKTLLCFQHFFSLNPQIQTTELRPVMLIQSQFMSYVGWAGNSFLSGRICYHIFHRQWVFTDSDGFEEFLWLLLSTVMPMHFKHLSECKW